MSVGSIAWIQLFSESGNLQKTFKIGSLSDHKYDPRSSVVFPLRLLCWSVCCWCPGMDNEALPTLNVSVASPADTWSEIPVELRSWREEAVLATQVRCLFL